MLDRIACFAQIAVAAGLNIAGGGPEIADRLQRDGTEPTQRLSRLFAISDLKQLEGHRKDEVDRRIEQAIERFGLDVRSAVPGWGATLDAIYDGAIADLAALDRTLAEAQALVARDGPKPKLSGDGRSRSRPDFTRA